MKQWSLALMMTVLAALTACSLGKDSGRQNTTLLQQNKDLQDLYHDLIGTYSGVMTTDQGDEKVDLIIWINSEKTKNPDGSDGSQDTVQALFRRNDPVVADYSLEVNGFSRETGDFSITEPAGPKLAVETIRAHYTSGHIKGDVSNSARGTFGHLQLDFVSSDTGTKDDAQERLYRQYQAVSGVYRGSLPGHLQPIVVTLSAALDGTTARLDGVYKDLDHPTGDLDLALTVTYRPDLNPPTITMNGRGDGKRALDFVGTLVGTRMEVDVTSPLQGGYLGHSSMLREDDFAKYTAVEGIYSGTWRKSSISMTFKAVRAQGFNSLSGTISVNRGPAASLAVTFDPDRGTLVGHAPGTGKGDWQIDCKFNGKHLTGTIYDDSGPSPINLSR